MSDVTLTVYVSTVAANMEIKKKQQKIHMILDGKKIPYQEVDIAASSDAKDRMRQISGNPTALPPQICNGNDYCGDFDAFEDAVECETLKEFLKI